MEILGIDLNPVEVAGVVVLSTVLLALAIRNLAPLVQQVRIQAVSWAVTDLLRRRVPQIVGVYLAVGWGVLEFASWLVDRYGFSASITTLSLVAWLSMLPTVLMLAYFHGGRGAQEWNRIEKIGIPANLVIAGALLLILFAGEGFLPEPAGESKVGERRQLTFSGDVAGVALSPDKQLVAYVRRTGELLIQDIRGGEPHLISDGAVFNSRWIDDLSFRPDRGPRWSSDGSHVRFYHETLGLVQVPRLGGSPRSVSEVAAQDTAFSFVRLDDDDIILTPRTRVSSRTAGYFLRAVSRGNRLYRLAMDPGDAPKLVRDGLPRIWSWDVSSDGKRLVFAGGEAQPPQLRLTRFSSGRTPTNELLTHDSYRYSLPCWSPDGDSVAYVKGTAESPGDIYFRGVGIGNERRVATHGRTPGRHIHGLSWSPDGARLALVDHPVDEDWTYRGDWGRYDSSLWVIDLGSGQAREIGESSPDGFVAWSPNGTEIIYAPRTKPVLVHVPPGTGRDRLPDVTVGRDHEAVFSPDGRRVLLSHSRDGRLWMIALDDMTATLFSQVRARPLLWTTEGTIYLQPIGTNRIETISSSGGEPELYMDLPFDCEGRIALRGGASALCAVSDYRSDVWVIDNFDPRAGG